MAAPWGSERAAVARVAWLPAHRTDLVALSDALREGLRAHLQRLCDDVHAAGTEAPGDAWVVDDATAAESHAAPLADAVACGTCQGLCCRLGGQHQAFIGAAQMRRWRRDHPGQPPDAAVQAYLDALPTQHVDGSCVFHGAQGCTLARERRADVCNRYACEPLRSMRAAPGDDWIVAVPDAVGGLRHAGLRAEGPPRSQTPAVRTPATAARPGPKRCAECGNVLDPLRARLHEVCSQPACLQRVDERAQRRWRDAQAARLRGRLPEAEGDPTPVFWIRPYESTLVPLPAALRDAQIARLGALAADPASATAVPAAPAPEAATPHRAEGQLCAWCGGRCCRYGGESLAYLQATHLRRWQQAHPQLSLTEVAAAYIARLPSHHMSDSCAFHGERGCTLDRDMRSDVCNRFVCDGLRELQTACRDGAAEHAVFVRAAGRRIEAAARADAAGVQPLTVPPEEP